MKNKNYRRIHDEKGMTHQQIGDILGLSHTMVQNIERSALRKLRKSILRDFEVDEHPLNYYELLEEQGD